MRNKTKFITGTVFKNGDIGLPVSDREVMDLIERRVTIVLKNVFAPVEMRRLIDGMTAFAKTHPSENPEFKPGVRNFQRLDLNPEKSKVKRISRCFNSYYWNKRDICGERPYLEALGRLRNRLVGLPADYAFNDINDSHISAPNVMQYPVGGGYLQPHVDPPSKQKVVVIAILSERGKDYRSGGVYVEDPDGSNRLLVDEAMGPGDVYLMNPAIRHGVAPIDPDEKLDLESTRGRWMMFSTLVPFVSLTGGKSKGLVAY